MPDGTLPVIQPNDLSPPSRRTGEVVGVILAAGGSTRFGDANKLLTRIDGEPMVARSVDTFLESDLPSVLAILGDDAASVSAALADAAVETIHNDRWEDGQSTSVIAGLRGAMERDATAVVFGLGDMPWVRPRTVNVLLEAYAATEAPVIAAAHQGRRGNPVLFTDATFDRLLGISGDTGGREVLLGCDDAVAIETGDPGVHRDVDHRDDLRKEG